MRDLHLPGRSAVLATNGMCATSNPIAALAAIDILRQGGNAIDAAIAGAIVLGVAEPQMTGLGGDCFALIAPPDGSDVIAVNGSGRAPKAANAADLRAQGFEAIPPSSAHAVTIPGAVDAFCRMSERYGKLGLADSLAPAIRYMEQGVPVAHRTQFDWASATGALQGAARKHFLLNGNAPRIGDLFSLPGNAQVLRRLAKHGRDAYYQGEVADDILAALTAAGGHHTAQDFDETCCTVSSPTRSQYKSRQLLEHPPNGQGVTAHLLLNILSHFDLPSMDPLGALRFHIEAEATKLAYDARNRFVADPDYMTKIDHLLDPSLAAKLAALIDPNRVMASPDKLSEQVHKDTIFISVVDKDRMAVSLIYSIFHSFGSGIASDKFGILLQNRGAGFTLQEDHPNELGGGKRPMHTIIPGMLSDNDRIVMPFGVMGGQYQPTGHAHVLSNLLDYDMDLQTALDYPRGFATDGVLQLERGIPDATKQELADLGHTIEIPDTPLGGAQAIMIHDNGVLSGASDPRKDGCALGY